MAVCVCMCVWGGEWEGGGEGGGLNAHQRMNLQAEIHQMMFHISITS